MNQLRLVPKNGEQFELDFALYNLVCGKCEDSLEWTLNPDPDSLYYRTEHTGDYADCNLVYTLTPYLAAISIATPEDSE